MSLQLSLVQARSYNQFRLRRPFSLQRFHDVVQQALSAAETGVRLPSRDARGQRQPCVRTACDQAVWLRQVSGKNWKAPAPRMSATGTAKLKTSWEKKMAAKAEAALFREQKQEARADHNAKLMVGHRLLVACHSRGCAVMHQSASRGHCQTLQTQRLDDQTGYARMQTRSSDAPSPSCMCARPSAQQPAVECQLLTYCVVDT